MKIKDIITEGHDGERLDHDVAGTGEWKFRDEGGFDRVYNLNRVMMAVASTDGKTFPNSPSNGWSSRYNTSHPFTKEEADMLKLAYKAAGIEYVDDLNDGDLESDELGGVNKQSPVKPFKGYKK